MENQHATEVSEELGISSESLDEQGVQAEGACEQDASAEPIEGQEQVEGATSEVEEKSKEKAFEVQISEPVKVRDFEDVKKAVLDHAVWIDSVINPRAAIKVGRANFKGNDLSGMNLAGVDLRGATFSHTICRGTIFTGANLSGAHFNHADLSGADLRGCKLKRANFDHAVLIGVDWDDAILDNATFRYAQKDGQDTPEQQAEAQANEEAMGSAEDLSESETLQGAEVDGHEIESEVTDEVVQDIDIPAAETEAETSEVN